MRGKEIKGNGRGSGRMREKERRKEIGWEGEEKAMMQDGSRHWRNKSCFL
jgi:hypothetical protein